MKNSKIILFALAIISLCFTACQKDDLVEETTANKTELNEYPQFENAPLGLVSSATFPLNTIIKKESDCILKGSNLRALRVTVFNTTVALNLDKYAIEWFNESYDLLSETDLVQCVTAGTYQTIIWDKISGETSTKTYTITGRNEQIYK